MSVQQKRFEMFEDHPRLLRCDCDLRLVRGKKSYFQLLHVARIDNVAAMRNESFMNVETIRVT